MSQRYTILRSETNRRLQQLAGHNEIPPGPSGPHGFRLPDRVHSHFYVGSGGIAARTGATTGPWTPGVATCTMCEYYLDGSTVKIRQTSPAINLPVYNDTPTAVVQNKLIQAKLIDGRWTIDVEPC